MQIPEKIKNLGKGVWWVISAFGILFGIWGVYVQVSQYPNISSQIISETNVLDINEPLKDLQIFFKGDNIQEENLNLRVYRVKIENNGGTNIAQKDFDQNDNLGITVDGGRVIETRLVDSNSEYINENLSPLIQSSTVKFNKIVFDKGNFFVVELLVLHNKNVSPVLHRIGKISGIKEDESEILALERGEPFWVTFFYGNLFMNLARFIAYGLIGIIILFVIVGISLSYQERKRKAAQKPQLPQQPS